MMSCSTEHDEAVAQLVNECEIIRSERDELEKKLKEAQDALQPADFRELQESSRISQAMEETTLLIHASLGNFFWFFNNALVYNFNIFEGQTAAESEALRRENADLRVSLENLQVKFDAAQAQLTELRARLDAAQLQ